jgi:putative hydrolase of the HAD superfamily
VIQSKRAVLFDLFHTLTSLEATWSPGRPFTYQMLGVGRRAWDDQLQLHSRERLVGAQTDPYRIVGEMARAIDPWIPEERIRAATENRIARFADAIRGIPAQTGEVLARLRAAGKRLGLVSNADVMEVAAWGESPIRQLFDSTVFSCAAGCMKPEREIYERSLRELGVPAAQAAFVGDGGSGELEGARRVGLTAIMITGIVRQLWPERIEERRPHADFVIEELTELLERDA